MPAIVTKVLVRVGSPVKKGEALVLLEAMKMELPLRAEGDAVVTAIHCLEGARVEAGAVLVDLE
jgi:biotin carboxyl carrier protein